MVYIAAGYGLLHKVTTNMSKKGPSTTYAAMGQPIMIRALAGLTKSGRPEPIYRIPPNTTVFAKKNNEEEKLSDGSKVVVAYTELPNTATHTEFHCIGISVTPIFAPASVTPAHRLFTVCVWGPAIINNLPRLEDTCVGQTLYIQSTGGGIDDDFSAPHNDHYSMSVISTLDSVSPNRKIMLLNRSDSAYGEHGGLVFLCGLK